MSMKNIFLIITIPIIAISCVFFCGSVQSSPLHVGATAPDFKLPDQSGKLYTLKDFLGKKVALCFYPMDSTPGCTKEMCSLRNGWKDLQESGVTVFGISFDGIKSHKKFAGKYQLSFPILSDSEKKVGKAYGVKKWFFPSASRVTFLIDEKGIIAHVIKDVDVKGHAEQIKRVWDL